MQYIYFVTNCWDQEIFRWCGMECIFLFYADDIFQPTDSGEGIYSKGVCVGDLQ